MRVSSPIGDLPFKPLKLRIRDGAMLIEGLMGAWPATVEIQPSDVPGLLRLTAKPVAAAVLTLGIASAVRWHRHAANSTRKERQ